MHLTDFGVESIATMGGIFATKDSYYFFKFIYLFPL